VGNAQSVEGLHGPKKLKNGEFSLSTSANIYRLLLVDVGGSGSPAFFMQNWTYTSISILWPLELNH
jgi:hypothetical protein